MAFSVGDYKAVTVLRGDALTDKPSKGDVFHLSSPTNNAGYGHANHPISSTSSATSDETIYGVPVSAVQHCCGRGCKHCRIYWHRMKS